MNSAAQDEAVDRVYAELLAQLLYVADFRAADFRYLEVGEAGFLGAPQKILVKVQKTLL